MYSIKNVKNQEKRLINWRLEQKLKTLKRESAKAKAKAKAKKDYEEFIEELEMIKFLPPAKEVIISVTWKKSSVWGSNPHAEIKIFNHKGHYEIFDETASGCGYDKLSSVISYGFNKSKLLKSYMLKHTRKLNQLKKENGYSLYALLNDYSFQGGVGVSAYRSLFQALGCKFEHYSTDTSDFIKIEL